jgi:hypothetical protein
MESTGDNSGDYRERRKVRICASLVSKIHQRSCSYVTELLEMREAFINPLLHPNATSSSTMPEYDDMSQEHSPIASHSHHLPVVGSGDSEDDNGRAGTSFRASRGAQVNLSFAPEHDPREPLTSRTPGSHQFLRPPRPNRNVASTAPLGRGSFVEPSPGGVAPRQLPEDLWLCLGGIEGILADHLKLCGALRKRYDEQYPLVRSLTDIFLANVTLSILLSDCPDCPLTLALVTHPPGL